MWKLQTIRNNPMSRATHRRQVRRLRSAFTLVEMLVAVALISILMLMFAQIFSLASDVVGQQRGIAANDQVERQLRTAFRNDLNHRTFRDVRPFESADTSLDNQRLGYFHITEGITSDDTDDVIQLTIERDVDEDPIYGRAKTISGSTIAGDPNQPEFDDELVAENNAGSSRFGEVVYFLRNGNLYRRSFLIREPKVGSSDDPTADPAGGGAVLIGGAYTNDFWQDFDYAAYFDAVDGRVNFHGIKSLENTQPDSVSPQYNSMPARLGIPRFRWGFDVNSGQPRRMVTDTSSIHHHIGRFTQQETSDPAFNYPGENPTTDWFTASLNYDTANGVLTDLNDGPRVAEDILLRNVHSFDIKVWDPAANTGADGQPGIATDGTPGGLGDDDGNGVDDNPEELGWPGSDDGDWRDLGHNDANGFYRTAANQNLVFGEYPGGDGNGNCFDTWHPINNTLEIDNPLTVPVEVAPVMPGANPPTPGPNEPRNLAPYRPVLVHTVNGDLPQPLTMIRIHIRYVDQKSDQMRDVIIVHSLTD